MANEIAIKLDEFERKIKALEDVRQAYVHKTFPVGRHIVVLKGSAKGWLAVVVGHGYGTDIRVRNIDTGITHTISTYWIKEARYDEA